MLIRLMTLATVLMLLACLMLGATIALARSAKSFEINSLHVATDATTSASPLTTTQPVQADPDVPRAPYQENLADAGSSDQYDFDQMPMHSGQEENRPLPYAAFSDC